MSQSLLLATDGGARGNPGPAAVAFVFSLAENSIAQAGFYLGELTNNQAEYLALNCGLSFYLDNQTLFSQSEASHITIQLDAELVVRQLSGQYRVKDSKLAPLHRSVNTLLARLPLSYDIIHVPRESNQQADALVNQALDRLLQ